MIISHEHKFIFIRIPECADISIAKSLFPYLTGKEYEVDLNEHSTSKEIKQKISPKIWDNYFKFSFIRSPWGREIALHESWNRTKSQISFNEYILKYSCGWGEETLLDFLVDKNPRHEEIELKDINVDYVGRYETLEKDLGHIGDILNLPNITARITAEAKAAVKAAEAAAIQGLQLAEMERGRNKGSIAAADITTHKLTDTEKDQLLSDMATTGMDDTSVIKSYYSGNKAVIGKMYGKYHRDIDFFNYELPDLFDSPEDLNKLVYLCGNFLCPGHSKPNHTCA